MIEESPRVGLLQRLLLVRSAMLIAVMIAPAIAPAAPATLVGKDAPDFVLRALDGRNLRLSEFRGQVVLVNFWARWEGDTREQMRALDRINTTYERAGLVVLGVSVDEDVPRAREFAQGMAVSYPILFDNEPDVGKDYKLQKMPVTILVDRGGVVRYWIAGFKRSDETAYVDRIRELLRE